MSAKRGDRAAPPARPGGYTLRFATNDAAKGWEELCRQAAANTRAAFDAIESNPCPFPSTNRQHPLKGLARHRRTQREDVAAVAI